MPARKEEILAKRAKLEEIKRQRELRQKETSSFRQSIGTSPSSRHAASPGSNVGKNKQEVEDLVTGLIGDGHAPSTPRSQTSPPTRDRSQPPSHADNGENRDSLTTDGLASPPRGQYATSSTQTLEFSQPQTLYEIRSEPPKREVLMYSKGVQTTQPWVEESSRSTSDSESDPALKSRRRPSRRQKERDEELRQKIRKEIEEEVKESQKQQPDGSIADEALQRQKYPARILSDEELNAVTSSNDFLEFVERSSKVIERALDEEYDLLADYRAGNLTGLDDEDDETGGTGRKGRRVKEVMQFYDERWSKRRMVSDISFSSKYPELLLSAHTKNPSAPYDPSGLVLVWNQHMQSRPEYIFHATSDVLTAKFSPFHPNLILGGSYSGQVLLWDTRARSAAPVQKSPLTGTGSGHTHPIYSLNIIGTQNAHNIISTSTDGVLCSWSIDMLSQPQEHLQLSRPSTTSSSTAAVVGSFQRPDDLAPTCTAFPASDPTYFLAGTEEGHIHLCHRYDRAGAKAGVDPHVTYKGHMAPVMSLDFHSPVGHFDLGDLVLSTGLDWSVRLWRIRIPAAAAAVAAAAPTHPSSSTPNTSTIPTQAGTPAAGGIRDVHPLLEIQRDDAVYDAKWSPSRPGVFATADGAGFLDVWDLTHETEVPVARVSPSQRPETEIGGGAAARQPRRSLNKCAWEAGEGRRLACAGLDGVVTLFEVGAELGGSEGARAEQWAAVKKLVGRLENR